MTDQEGTLIAKAQIEVSARNNKGKKSYPYPEEWVLWYLGLSNHKNTNANIFKDVYFLCRDVVVPNMNSYELF